MTLTASVVQFSNTLTQSHTQTHASADYVKVFDRKKELHIKKGSGEKKKYQFQILLDWENENVFFSLCMNIQFS